MPQVNLFKASNCHLNSKLEIEINFNTIKYNNQVFQEHENVFEFKITTLSLLINVNDVSWSWHHNINDAFVGQVYKGWHSKKIAKICGIVVKEKLTPRIKGLRRI